MPWTTSATGTLSAVIGTEAVLATDTTNATYYFQVRLNNVVGNDVVELRIYTMTLPAGTLEVTWKTTIGPSPPPTIVIASPPQPSDQSIRVTIKQVAGVGRNFDWKLLRA